MVFFDDLAISNKRRFSLWAISLSVMVTLLIGVDIGSDYGDGVPWPHLITELLILMLSLVGVVYFGYLYHHATKSKINALRQDLEAASLQAEQWRTANRELIQGLAAQIQKQFDSWQLTQAEAEVGLLILKGLSHADIAEVRNASERTIRDQARAIYRKSGLAGRTGLSAFFLEDLLLPRQ